MNRVLVALAMLWLAGCSHCAYMDYCSFSDICIGDDICDVTACNGSPFCKSCCEDGTVEYHYVDRDRRRHDHNGGHTHFYLRVKDGHVVDKCMECFEEPMDIIMHDGHDPF